MKNLIAFNLGGEEKNEEKAGLFPQGFVS